MSGSAFRDETNFASAWSGAIGDFYAEDLEGIFPLDNLGSLTTRTRFAAESQGSIQVRFHRGMIILEPRE